MDAINKKIGTITAKADMTSQKVKMKFNNMNLVSRLKIRTSKAMAGLRRVQQKVKEIGKSGKDMAQGGVSKLVAGAGIAATVLFPVKKAQDFQTKMLGVKSIVSGMYGTTGDELARLDSDYAELTDKAKQLGNDTQWSASQVAEGMKFMSMAGFDAGKTIGAIEGTLSLATVGNLDLARATDIATNTLSGFGIKADKMNMVSDAMAKTITTSNTTVESLGESFKYVAPISKGLGTSIFETSAMIGKLGDAGINGTVAGNALKRMMLNLSAPTSKVSKALKELNVNPFDKVTGKFKPMAEQIGMIQDKIKDMPQAAKVGYLKDIFGTIALPSALVLLEQGQKGIEKYTEALENSEGVSKRIADIQLSGAGGKLKLLQSAFEGLMIAIGDNFLESASGAYEKITEIIGNLTKWANENKALMPIIGNVVIAIGSFVAVMGVLAVVMGVGAMALGALSPLLLIITGKFGLVAIATWLWNSALLANPITWVVIAIIALIAAIVAVIVYFDEIVIWIKKTWQEFDVLNGYFGMITTGLGFIGDAFGYIIDPIKLAIEWLDTFLSKFDIYNTAKQKISNVAGSISDSIGDAFDSAKEMVGIESNETKYSETSSSIDNTTKNYSVIDVNVTASEGATAETQSRSTENINLMSVENGI